MAIEIGKGSQPAQSGQNIVTDKNVFSAEQVIQMLCEDMGKLMAAYNSVREAHIVMTERNNALTAAVRELQTNATNVNTRIEELEKRIKNNEDSAPSEEGDGK